MNIVDLIMKNAAEHERMLTVLAAQDYRLPLAFEMLLYGTDDPKESIFEFCQRYPTQAIKRAAELKREARNHG